MRLTVEACAQLVRQVWEPEARHDLAGRMLHSESVIGDTFATLIARTSGTPRITSTDGEER